MWLRLDSRCKKMWFPSDENEQSPSRGPKARNHQFLIIKILLNFFPHVKDGTVTTEGKKEKKFRNEELVSFMRIANYLSMLKDIEKWGRGERRGWGQRIIPLHGKNRTFMFWLVSTLINQLFPLIKTSRILTEHSQHLGWEFWGSASIPLKESQLAGMGGKL